MAIGDVKARIVRSDGQEMTIGDGDWRIPNDGLVNWANLPYSVFSSEIPASDGAIITSKRVSSVDRTITAECKGDDPEELRSRAIRFFNPKHSYKVYMTYMGRTRWCEGEQIGFKASEGNIYKPPSITWTILCANPYLQSVEDFGKDIAEVIGMFGFPWVSFLPEEYGSVPGTNEWAVVSEHTFSQSVDVVNDGDVPSGLRVTIRATGDVVNPSIRLGEGWIRILTPMRQGDRIDFDASSKPPTVKLNGENAMHLVDRESSILNMRIEVGETTIEYDADDGYQNMSATVYWNKQYLGV